MENNRKDLAEQLEIIGEMLEIDGVSDLLAKFRPGMNTLHINAITLQICSLLLSKRKATADKLVAMHKGCTIEEANEMDDAAFSIALRDAVLGDALCFFGSSPATGGRK